MSEDLEDLLAREGHEDVDALMGWARERAAELVPEIEQDGELGPLLGAGGEAGAAEESAAVASETPAPTEARAPSDTDTDAQAEALRVEQVALAARREASNAAPLPPIPVATPAVPTDELDVEEIEELDMEELEMVEDDGGDDEESGDEAGDAVSTASAPAPMPPGPPAVETPPESEGNAATAEGEDSGETTSFGPPDGNEHVPEWKAALLSTQTATDQEAAERVKEASSAGPLPQMEFPQEEGAEQSARLESEDDEVSQHSVDLSDLDTDDT
ncbi:MAG: hypothetical protein ACRBN8_35800 [Nannocystales bacterium]